MGNTCDSFCSYLVAAVTVTLLSVPMIFLYQYHYEYILERGLHALVYIAIAYFALVVGLYLIAWASNPGTVPKQPYPSSYCDLKTNTNRRVSPSRHLEVLIRGQVHRIKYCVTCNLYRPPGTVHCSSCDVCILKYDHHCPYIVNCIGYNNYKIFIAFVLVCVVYFALMLGIGMYRVYGLLPRFKTYIDEYPWTFAGNLGCLVYNFLSLWLVLGLYGFHLFLICKGETTHDRLKGYDVFNSRGCLLNLKACLSSARVKPSTCKAMFLSGNTAADRCGCTGRNSSAVGVYNPTAKYRYCPTSTPVAAEWRMDSNDF